MTTTQTTRYTLKRLKNSVMGNPRYELRDQETGNIIGTTRPDSSLAYGDAPNNVGNLCEITVYTTMSGRRYIESIDKVS